MIQRAAITLMLVLFCSWMACQRAQATVLRADAVVERQSVFLGAPFVFQIQVSGSEAPERPSLEGLSGFTAQFQGGRQNSSSSVTIINGRMQRTERKGYVFSYQLTARKTGVLTIPSITVRADGQTARTAPVQIEVRKPAESDNFKLRLKLSRKSCYVGEPVVLTVTWYIGSDVRGFSMSLPLLGKTDSFTFVDPEVDTASGGKFYRIPLSGGEVIGRKGQGRLEGKDYATITFQKVLIPRKPGSIQIAPATVVCEALTGYQRRRSMFGDDFFSDFFNDDFFGSGHRGVYSQVAVPSNALDLEVLDVPDKGQPDGFAGHVGTYHIEAAATPTQMSVGDPITLKITVSGPDYPDQITLPPLNRQAAMKKNFKIPQERSIGETVGKTKVFTQTIRPLQPGKQEIPPIELPYFDTRTGTYRIARTRPIPLTVKAARVVTALDAEGAGAAATAAGSEVQTWSQGIAFNYEDMSVIENQRFGPLAWLKSPALFTMMALPPLIYVMLLLGSIVVKRVYANPSAARARRAYGTLCAALKKSGRAQSGRQCCDAVLDALRTYLGDKLGLPGGALTFYDAEKPLTDRGIATDTLRALQEIFEHCDAGRYAGTSGTAAPPALAEQTLRIAQQLEKELK